MVHRDAAEDAAGGAQRQLVFDQVLQPARSVADGLEPMRVAPACERAFDLNVDQPAARLVLDDLGDPAAADGSHADAQYDAPAGLLAAAAFEDTHVLPPRPQALEGSCPYVPFGQVVDRHRDCAAPLEDRHEPLLHDLGARALAPARLLASARER